MELSARTSGLWRMLSASVMGRMTRAGTPAAKLPAGMSLVTTEPAPMTQPSPMVTPGQTVTFAPNQQSLPMCTGFAQHRRWASPPAVAMARRSEATMGAGA